MIYMDLLTGNEWSSGSSVADRTIRNVLHMAAMHPEEATDRHQPKEWKNLQLDKWLQIGYNSSCPRETNSKKEVKRCFSSLAIPVATPIVTPSGRFSAGSAASAAK